MEKEERRVILFINKMVKGNVKLSDMLMMQMIGGLEEFASHVDSDTLPKNYVEKVKEEATTPKIFKDIVRKTITTQFGNPLTSLRELGQNARDSYQGDQEKNIEFIVKSGNKEQFVSTRDYGCGMTPKDVFTMLLVPYNSGKEFDPKKIGEHGIGFFSNFDISNQMNVKTRNGSGPTTVLNMARQDDNWDIKYKLVERDFKGTEISMKLNKIIPENDIYQTLVQNIGFLNPEFVVTYNGERLNQLPDLYEEIGSEEIDNEKNTGDMKLGFAGKDLREKSFFKRAAHPGNLVMTQNGLYVKNPSVSELIEDEVLEDLIDRMTDLGYNFWVELPNNINLTKGRNNIIARDMNYITSATTEVFTQGILEKILEDENLVYEMDTQLADVVDRALGFKVNEKTFNWRKIGPALNNFCHFLKDTEINFSFKNLKFKFEIYKAMVGKGEMDNNQDLNAARKKRYAKAFSYGEIEGFSGRLIKKKLISAVQYGNKIEIKTKVSVLDLIDHYCDGTLHMFISNTLPKIDGIYVNPTNRIVSRVIDHLDSQVPDKFENMGFGIDIKEIWSKSKKGFLGKCVALGKMLYASGSSIKELFESNEEKKHDFRGTRREAFEQMVKKHNVGKDYLGLFDNLKYVDELVSKANNTSPAKIRLFGKQEGRNNETAHTNRFSMGFNVYDDTVKEYLDSIREGEYNEKKTRSLVELIIHEKAHDVMSLFNVSGDHGKEFYNKTKKNLRENLYNYCKTQEIDPYSVMNNGLSPVETEELTPSRLKSLL